MTTLAFDTHKAVKTLREAGFEDGQAEAVVATFGNAMSEDMATKTDVAALKTDVAALKTDVGAENRCSRASNRHTDLSNA